MGHGVEGSGLMSLFLGGCSEKIAGWHRVAPLTFLWDIKKVSNACRWKCSVCYVTLKTNSLLSGASSQIMLRK